MDFIISNLLPIIAAVIAAALIFRYKFKGSVFVEWAYGGSLHYFCYAYHGF